MKFATVLGALFGNNWMKKLPAELFTKTKLLAAVLLQVAEGAGTLVKY